MKSFSAIIAFGFLSACSTADRVPMPAAMTDQQTSPRAIVERLYQAAAAGDNNTIAALLGDDVEWVEAEGGPFEAGNPYIGAQGVGSGVFGPIAAVYEGFEVRPQRYTVDGNRVVVEGRYLGTHRRSGAKLNAQFAHVFSVQGDRIVAYQQYTDTYQWRRLADTGS